MLTQFRTGTLASRSKPLLVEPEQALVVGKRAGFADFGQDVDEADEFLRKLLEHIRRGLVSAQASGPPIGIASHTHVVVEIDLLAAQTVREESGDEKREVSRSFEEREPTAFCTGNGLAKKMSEGLIVVDSGVGEGAIRSDERIEQLHQVKRRNFTRSQLLSGNGFFDELSEILSWRLRMHGTHLRSQAIGAYGRDLSKIRAQTDASTDLPSNSLHTSGLTVNPRGRLTAGVGSDPRSRRTQFGTFMYL